MLPLARDSGGTLFFTPLDGDVEPPVLYGPYLDLKQAAKVADSFEGFLAAIKPRRGG